MAKRFFWLKLKKDFFKRHDIRIVEEMDNGKEYILFYLKLIVESTDHSGHLRFSETIPYNEKMLSIITNTNIDIVRSACRVFNELGLMEQLTDGTLFMTESTKMIGSETDSAERVRNYRKRQEKVKLLQSNEGVTKSNPNIDLDLELNIKRSLKKDLKNPFPKQKETAQQADIKKTIENHRLLSNGTNVRQMSDKNPPEIELELEKELKIKKDIKKEPLLKKGKQQADIKKTIKNLTKACEE